MPKQLGELPGINCVVSETCYPTDLTDEMLKDFRMIETIAQLTRLLPQQRLHGKIKLITKFNSSENVEACLNTEKLFLRKILLMSMLEFSSRRLCTLKELSASSMREEPPSYLKESGSKCASKIINWIKDGLNTEKYGMLTLKFIAEAGRLGSIFRVQYH